MYLQIIDAKICAVQIKVFTSLQKKERERERKKKEKENVPRQLYKAL